MLFWYGVLLS